ncbi:hypothetical protein GH714_004463 [Hevea brasiliensis]|uniref:Uncharacterized protein n=1 Tax=Hevea brasiliensis TaxID=3981 RepID=A0A6A6KGU4_HEVBR|nr:hypothetical protein GH714_004463 [Hevea brasiliensis]
MEPGEEEYSSRSSKSSLSEVDEKISDVKKRSTSPDPGDSQIEESHISTQTSLDSDFHFMSEAVDENQERKPAQEPRGNHTAEHISVMQTSFDSDFQFTRGVEDDNRHIEPVFEPTGNCIGDSRILMQASLDSDSHFKTLVVDNDQQQEPVLEPSGRESCILTQTSLHSDFHFTSGVVDDNQHKEPVYDSSPQAVDKFLSLLSISSDTQGVTSEMGSPPALAEFSGKESEVHTENMGKNASGHKKTHEGSSKEQSLDEMNQDQGKLQKLNLMLRRLGCREMI